MLAVRPIASNLSSTPARVRRSFTRSEWRALQQIIENPPEAAHFDVVSEGNTIASYADAGTAVDKALDLRSHGCGVTVVPM
jgi:hypothetical protein